MSSRSTWHDACAGNQECWKLTEELSHCIIVNSRLSTTGQLRTPASIYQHLLYCTNALRGTGRAVDPQSTGSGPPNLAHPQPADRRSQSPNLQLTPSRPPSSPPNGRWREEEGEKTPKVRRHTGLGLRLETVGGKPLDLVDGRYRRERVRGRGCHGFFERRTGEHLYFCGLT